MKRYVWRGIFAFAIVWSFASDMDAQKTVTLRNIDNEELIGAEVFLDEEFLGLSDHQGQFIIPIESDFDTLRVTYLGFKPIKIAANRIVSDPHFVIMEPDYQVIKEIKVVGRTNEKITELPYQIERIGSEEIISSHSQTAAELLNKNGGIYIQKSQMGGGSPVIRGFEANKILLVIDGVRLNNAIYRNGHLQNAITIDPNALESAEVIFGPGSLNYGSDAIGGVVHYRSKSPVLNFDTSKDALIKTSISSRFASANQEKRIHADLNFGKRKWASFTSLSYVDFSDLLAGQNTPDAYPDFGKRYKYIDPENNDTVTANPNEFRQIFSAYSQWDALQKFKFQLSDQFQFLLNLQYSNSSDVPRYDQLTETQEDGNLLFSEWYYGPQQRILISPTLKWSDTGHSFFDELIVIPSFQRIDEDRFLRRFGTTILNSQFEDLKVWANTVDFKKAIGKFKLNYGLEAQHNIASSTALDDNLENNTQTLALTRYPSAGSKLTNWGMYLSGKYKLSQNINWDNGIRYSGQRSSFSFSTTDPFDWPDFYFDGFENSNQAFTWMSAVSFQPNEIYTIRATAGSAFRAPNIDDMAKVRIKGEEITIPNPALNPEKTINSEISLNVAGQKMSLNVTAFYTRLSDAIVRQPTSLPNGAFIFVTDQNDSLTVAKNVNASSAKVYGSSLQFDLELLNHLKWGNSISYVLGKQKDEQGIETPLGHIPPLYGRSFIGYNRDKLNLKLSIQFNAKKDIEDYGGTVDNPEFATPDGTPGWMTWNVYSDYKLNDRLTIFGAVENITDLHYRPFASGISAAGRNFVLSFKLDLD